MIKFIIVLTILIQLAFVAPGHAFLDYLFSGRQSRDAIDNSMLGDFRAWWTGNPMYQFNPYYQPNQVNPQGQQGGFPGGAAPQAQAPQNQPPVVNYYPPQQGVPGPYGQIAPQGAQPTYGPPAGSPQQYQMMQPGMQQYPPPAQTYQYAPQSNYQPAPQQMMYQSNPQGYQGPPAGYQGMAPGGQ